YYRKLDADPKEGPAELGTFRECVLPIIEAGRADLVTGLHRLNEYLDIMPAPGHSAGHVVFKLESGSSRALFIGDVLHHLIQVYHPDWNFPKNSDAEQARASRRKVLEHCASIDALMMPAHVGAPFAGRIEATAKGFVPHLGYPGKNWMIVDVHPHALSEKFLAALARRPVAGISSSRDDSGTYFMRGGGWDRPSSLDVNLHDLPHRLESLCRRQVELQLFAPPPGFFAWAGGAASPEWVRALHEQEIELAAQAEGLMEPMLVFALGEPAHVVDEARRALDRYPFRSGMLPSTAGGRPLDDPVFEPMWSLIEE